MMGEKNMNANPYKKFENTELILRDELAIDRTILANERTLLSYLRGAITLIISGITFMHFIQNGLLRYVGIAIIPLGFVIGILGFFRYKKINERLTGLRKY